MKKYSAILIVLFAVLFFSSCEKDSLSDIANRPYQPVTGDLTGGYVQFMSGNYDLVVNKLNAAGDAADATYSITVKNLGPVSNVDRTVNFTLSDRGVVLDAEGDTIMVPATANMYTLSANSFVIKAGEVSSSIDITLINAELPLEEKVYFDLEITGGDIELASNTLITTVTLFKKDFCPWTNADIVGTYDITYAEHWGQVASITEHWVITQGEGDTLLVQGLYSNNGPTAIWGEPIVAGKDNVIKIVIDGTDPINPNCYMPLNPDGTAQFACTSQDPGNGALYDYYIFDYNTIAGAGVLDWELDYCGTVLYMYYVVGPATHDAAWAGGDVALDYGAKKGTVYVNGGINSSLKLNNKVAR